MKQLNILWIIGFVVTMAFSPSWAQRYSSTFSGEASFSTAPSAVREAVSMATADLGRDLLKGGWKMNRPMAVTTLVNLNNFQETSVLGRLISEEVGIGLSRLGIALADMRVRKESLLIREKTGEFLLSRDLEKIAKNNGLQAFVGGTMLLSESEGIIHVQLRILRAEDNRVLAATSFVIPLESTVASLLGSSPTE